MPAGVRAGTGTGASRRPPPTTGPSPSSQKRATHTPAHGRDSDFHQRLCARAIGAAPLPPPDRATNMTFRDRSRTGQGAFGAAGIRRHSAVTWISQGSSVAPDGWPCPCSCPRSSPKTTVSVAAQQSSTATHSSFRTARRRAGRLFRFRVPSPSVSARVAVRRRPFGAGAGKHPSQGCGRSRGPRPRSHAGVAGIHPRCAPSGEVEHLRLLRR